MLFLKFVHLIGDINMTKMSIIVTLASLAAVSATLSSAPAWAIPPGYVGYSVLCNNGDRVEFIAPQPGHPQYMQITIPLLNNACPGGQGGVDPEVGPTHTPIPLGTRPITLVSAINLPVLSADMVDLNNLGGDRVIETLGVDRAVIAAIREAQTRGAFTSAEDFALRVCPRTSVTLRASAIRIGTIEYRTAPQRDPRRLAPGRAGPVFSCVAGSGTYEVASRAHNYVGHVTLLK
jgi:hypothetical protein